MCCRSQLVCTATCLSSTNFQLAAHCSCYVNLQLGLKGVDGSMYTHTHTHIWDLIGPESDVDTAQRGCPHLYQAEAENAQSINAGRAKLT